MVEVEAAISSGLPRTTMVGLPDAALYEARDRCRAAMAAVGPGWPSDPVTINLSPATLPKAGSHYDLAIAAAVAAAGRRFHPDALEGLVLFGELGLDGRIRRVRGLLPALLAAIGQGFGRAVVPATQLREAALVDGLVAYGANRLDDLFDILEGGPGADITPAEPTVDPVPTGRDLADVAGQVDQHINLVAAHQIGQRGVIESCGVAPLVGGRAKPLGHGVNAAHVAVTKDFEVAVIVGRDCWLTKECHGVFAKMRRHIAHPQPPVWIARILVRCSAERERLGVADGPITMFGRQAGCVVALMGIEGINQIGVAGKVLRSQLNRATMG